MSSRVATGTRCVAVDTVTASYAMYRRQACAFIRAFIHSFFRRSVELWPVEPRPADARQNRARQMHRRETGEWLTTTDVARLLRISVQKLKLDRSKHEGPPFTKIGRSVRYSREELERYLELVTIRPT